MPEHSCQGWNTNLLVAHRFVFHHHHHHQQQQQHHQQHHHHHHHQQQQQQQQQHYHYHQSWCETINSSVFHQLRASKPRGKAAGKRGLRVGIRANEAEVEAGDCRGKRPRSHPQKTRIVSQAPFFRGDVMLSRLVPFREHNDYMIPYCGSQTWCKSMRGISRSTTVPWFGLVK